MLARQKNLKNRVNSYFKSVHADAKTSALVAHVARVDYTLVHSEVDALILENDFIKQFQPKYNVLLRDDKSYPYIFLSAHVHPRLGFYRGKPTAKGTYFGPYPNSAAVRQSLHLMQKIFPIRQCEDTFIARVLGHVYSTKLKGAWHLV